MYGGGEDISSVGIGTPSLRLSLCLLATYACTFLLQWRGVKSIGKAAYVTGLAPFLTLAILLINGLTLDGSWTGIQYFVYPDFTKVLEPKVFKRIINENWFIRFHFIND